MSDTRPIGVFDSGSGGLSVLKELIKDLPHESFIYFADTANCPYGSKSPETIIKRSSEIVDFLINKNCKAIVVACNTATAAAIDWLRDNYQIPFIGMEPAVKPAALNSKTKSIGVLATAGTFKGRLYIETSRRFASDVNVCYQIGEGLVELVEGGDFNSFEAEQLLMKYIQPMLDCNIDQLVLGCTHYPFFNDLLKKKLPDYVTIIDPAPAVSKQLVRILDTYSIGTNVTNNSIKFDFYSSSSTKTLELLVSIIEAELGYELHVKTFIDNFSVPVV